MAKIKPFDGYLIKPDQAGAVVSPAYDSVTAEQRRKFAEENPENFINTMRLQEDYPQDRQPSQEQLLSDNKTCLEELISRGCFEAFDGPCMFIYQLGGDSHVQTGLVCEVAVQEYEDGLLRKHENTRSVKEDLLARYQEVVGASSSPICLTYPKNPNIDELISTYTKQKPDLDFTTSDGETQRVWCISNAEEQQKLQQSFAQVDAIYLTDGHHRAASGRRYAQIMRDKNNSNTGDEPFNQLLIALFPDDQLNLLPFHRCVKDTGGKSTETIIADLAKCFDVDKLAGETEFAPNGHGEFGMLIEDTWYRLTLASGIIDKADPVDCLDVSVLQDLILDPVFGIKDSRDDPRLGFVAGVSGPDGIRQTVADGWQVVFVCYPTSIKQLMDVADADALMPPKSTYFDPKPRSGIFLRLK